MRRKRYYKGGFRFDWLDRCEWIYLCDRAHTFRITVPTRPRKVCKKKRCVCVSDLVNTSNKANNSNYNNEEEWPNQLYMYFILNIFSQCRSEHTFQQFTHHWNAVQCIQYTRTRRKTKHNVAWPSLRLYHNGTKLPIPTRIMGMFSGSKITAFDCIFLLI